jgi:hypothetical protein
MEVYSIGTPNSTPNFGMALRIDPNAEDFIKALPAKERAYLKSIGKRIAHSRNNIDILANGEVSYSWTPRKEEIHLVDSASDSADNLLNKRVRKEMTAGEKLDIIVDSFGVLFKSLMIKLSFWKSKFMRSLQIGEQYVKGADFYDSVYQAAKTRLDIMDEHAVKDAKNIIKDFKD